MKEILFKIRVNVQQEQEIDRLKKRINELIVLRKKNNGLTAREDFELRGLRKDYNSLTGAIVKQNQVQKTSANTLGRVNAQLAIERQRIKDVVIDSKEFDTVAARIKNLENKQRAANAAMGRGTTFVGEYARGAIQAFQKIAAGVMAAVIALRSMSRIFKGIIETLTEFEQGQMNVQTLLEDFDEELRGESIILMRKYGLAISDTNRALFDAVSAGVAARDSFKFMNEAAILAVAGVSDMESVVDGMTTVMNVWNLSMEDMEKVSAAFFSAQKKGKFYVSDITSEIGKVASIAEKANMSYQELMSTYAELTKRGLPLELSTTAIKAAIMAVSKPSEQAKKAFKDLEIQTGLTAVADQGLFTILKKINEATKDEKDLLTELVPNIRALTGITILNDEALRDYDEILKMVNEDYGEGASIMMAYGIQMTTLKKKKELLKASWDDLVLSSREGNAIGRIWGDTLVMLTGAVDKLKAGSEKLALASDLIFKSDRLVTWMLYTNELEKQFNATHGLLTEEEKLEEQRKIAAGEWEKRQKALRTAEDEEKARKTEAEEARKTRYEAQQKAEQQEFDDRITRMTTLFEAQQAFDASDKEAYDAVLAEFYATQEAKKLFSDQLNKGIGESISNLLELTLTANQESWKSEEEKFKNMQAAYKQTVGIFTDLGGQLVQMTNEAITQGELDLKKFGKIAISVALDTLQKIILMKRAEILAKALASPESIATFGAAGMIKFGIINALITAAFQTAKAVITANKGRIIPGQGNRDTIPARLTPGEAVINKRSMQSSDVMTLTGTPYDIASNLNSYKGFGIPFATGGVAGSVTNNTYNYNTMERMQSDISDIKVVLNMNEVSAGLNELNVIQKTSEI